MSESIHGLARIYRQNCDYCGGYYEGSKTGFLTPLSGASTHVTTRDDNGDITDDVSVCPKCFIKVFDTILGERKK